MHGCTQRAELLGAAAVPGLVELADDRRSPIAVTTTDEELDARPGRRPRGSASRDRAPPRRQRDDRRRSACADCCVEPVRQIQRLRPGRVRPAPLHYDRPGTRPRSNSSAAPATSTAESARAIVRPTGRERSDSEDRSGSSNECSLQAPRNSRSATPDFQLREPQTSSEAPRSWRSLHPAHLRVNQVLLAAASELATSSSQDAAIAPCVVAGFDLRAQPVEPDRMSIGNLSCSYS